MHSATVRVAVLLALAGCGGASLGDRAGSRWVSGAPPPQAAAPMSLPGAAARIAPADRQTTWNPGILSDGQLGLPLDADGIPRRTKVCATVDAARYGDGVTDAAGAIQSAIDACPPGQVVYLPAGTYLIARTLSVDKGIVLRGAGRGTDGTRIRAKGSGATGAIWIWARWPTYGPAVDVTANIPKGSTSVPVASAAGFEAGDVVQIDQLDDADYVHHGGCRWFKRPDYGPSSTGPRSQGQTVEVVGKRGNVLLIGTPIHLGYRRSRSPQVFKPTSPIVKWAGVEDLYVTGTVGGQPMIYMLNAAFCWVKNVETDGSTATGNGLTGSHVAIERSYRCVVRDGYHHDASVVVQGGGAYGIRIVAHTSDSLVENNVIRNLNKPLVTQASGGGNVVGYNFVDDAWTVVDPRMQETTIDAGHGSFSFMELFEGNMAAQLATDLVWGNSGWMTFFRNYASSQQSRTEEHERYGIAAIAFEGKAHYMNVVGNVLGAQGKGLAFENLRAPDANAVYRIGARADGGDGTGDIHRFEDPTLPGSTAYTLLRHGNFDYVTGTVGWSPAIAERALPDSLYLARKPAFFGEHQWPWVDPLGTTKVRVLPAKARFDAGMP